MRGTLAIPGPLCFAVTRSNCVVSMLGEKGQEPGYAKQQEWYLLHRNPERCPWMLCDEVKLAK